MPWSRRYKILHLQTAQTFDNDVTISHSYSSASTLASRAHCLISPQTFACATHITEYALSLRSTGSIPLSHVGSFFANAFGNSSIRLSALGGPSFSMSLGRYRGIFSMHCNILAAWLCSSTAPATIVDR